MNDKHALSARVKAAFEGCYEGSRAAALSGVPVSTVYLWARTGVVKPSVSPTKIKLWSYADLMALRIVYWLRHPKNHPKKGQSSYIAASPMQRVRDGLAELERHGLDIWDDSGSHPDSPLRVDSSANIFVVDENVARLGGQQPLTGMLDLLGPFESDGRWGPDLVRPRPNLRIIPAGCLASLTSLVPESLHRSPQPCTATSRMLKRSQPSTPASMPASSKKPSSSNSHSRPDAPTAGPELP